MTTEGNMTVSATWVTMTAVHTPPQLTPPPPAVPARSRVPSPRVIFRAGITPATGTEVRK